MDFDHLLELVGHEPVFESALLMAGNQNSAAIRLQLARWTNSGRLYQLRRGLYSLAPPYQKIKPHPFLVANRLQRASYVSLQSALAFYGLIPDVVHVTISVTAGRPARRETPLGIFEFRHIQPGLLSGYRLVDLGNGQQAFVASPEKALLDLAYLTPGGAAPEFLGELRLQNLDRLDEQELASQVETFHTPKLRRAAASMIRMARGESQEYDTL